MKKIILLFVSILSITLVIAQKKVLLEIENEKITADEFLHIYKKNNTDKDAMTYKAMDEYMKLFLDFKLKVYEAEQLGMDTTKAFVQELKGYRSQLAQPYLTDKSVEEDLVKEAYDRMKYDIKSSHILVKADSKASPEDTLKAWNKINEVYNKLLKGEDFVKLAKKYSEDESVKVNNGDLGYRTVFGLVYNFENNMYNTKVGEFSKPFRTRFGYHIVKVYDKRPAKGRFKVAHIMMLVPKGTGSTFKKEAKRKIEDIEKRLKAGESFEELAKELSQDRKTAEKGGEIGWVSVGGRMIPEFEKTVFDLEKPGDFSPILKTDYGYHIVKLLEIEGIKDFKDVKFDIKSKITNTARTSRSREAIIKLLMKEYDAKVIKDNVAKMYPLVTDSIFEGTWKVDENEKLDEVILTFADKKYYQKDFVKYINKFNRKQSPQNIKIFVDNSFKSFTDKMILMYEESILEDKYPSFKYLIKEYHDGILLFELTDKTVWSKAITDTLGLESFYSQNKNKYNWGYRYEVKKYQCNNPKVLSKLNKYISKNWDDEKILNKLNKKDSTAVVILETKIDEKGNNIEIDEIIKKYNISEKAGIAKTNLDKSNNQLEVIKVYKPAPKSLEDARGAITADYQDYLEKQWIEDLHKKYKTVVHQEVLKEIAE